MRTLHMTLHRRWFMEILDGTKSEEYREIKPYWSKRLTRTYDTVTFRNGYAKDSPVMEVNYLGFDVVEILHPIHKQTMVVYALKLGAVLSTRNCDKLVSDKQLSLAMESK